MENQEIENRTYLDIAYKVLKEKKEQKTTKELLQEVCKNLDIKENQCLTLIGDFYTDLNLDKRFVIVNNKWDLKEKTMIKEVEDLDDLDDEEIEETEIIKFIKEEDDVIVDEENIEDDIMDEFEGFTIIDDEEEEMF